MQSEKKVEKVDKVSKHSLAKLLQELGYSLQGNKKKLEGAQHPDRNAQFEHINETVRRQLEAGDPAISVDTKKKELVGQYKNAGRELRPKHTPECVNSHDFPDKEKGKAVPYGVYDLAENEAWVSVGISHDTAEFAVSTIRTWYQELGCELYPDCLNWIKLLGNDWAVKYWGVCDLLKLWEGKRPFPPQTAHVVRDQRRELARSETGQSQEACRREPVFDKLRPRRCKVTIDVSKSPPKFVPSYKRSTFCGHKLVDMLS